MTGKVKEPDFSYLLVVNFLLVVVFRGIFLLLLLLLMSIEEAIGEKRIGPLLVRLDRDALFQQWDGP